MDVASLQKNLPPILLALLLTHLDPIQKALTQVDDRDLASVELFSGDQAISRAVRAAGYEAANFDVKDNRLNDLSTFTGFQLALGLVARLRVAGMCWAAPVCSSWVWVGRSQTQRTAQNPAGDRKNKLVSKANQMVDYTCLLLLVAFTRGANIYLEQPNSSLLPQYPVAKSFFEWAQLQRVPTYLGSFGCASQKPILVFTNNAGATGLKRKRLPGKSHLVTRDASGAVTGKSTELKESQAYPEAFGQQVAKLSIEAMNATCFDLVFG